MATHLRTDGGFCRTVVETTGSTLANNGISVLSSTAVGAMTLAEPTPGVVKYIVQTTTSTALKTVTTSSGVTIGAAATVMGFTAIAQAVALLGISTTRWEYLTNTGSVASS